MNEVIPDEETVSATDETLKAQVALLKEENRQLRLEFAHAHQARYRSVAIGLVALGVVATFGGILFPDVRAVLFTLGAIGAFSGLLVYFLTPEHVIPASVGERVYRAMARNEASIADHLGLRDEYIYRSVDGTHQLYIPQIPNWSLPDTEFGPIVTQHRYRGLLLKATGGPLFDAFVQSTTTPLGTSPTILAEQLCDGVVEQFELADSIAYDVDEELSHVTFKVRGSGFGELDRFDHPVVSFLAIGLSSGTGRPIKVDINQPERVIWQLQCEILDEGQ